MIEPCASHRAGYFMNDRKTWSCFAHVNRVALGALWVRPTANAKVAGR